MTTFESLGDYLNVTANVSSLARTQLDLKAIRRVFKVHFTTDVEALKLATIQSFKGWESKTIILLIQPQIDSPVTDEEKGYYIQTRQNIPAHIYTAITRARENLFILNMGNPVYHNFFKTSIQND